MRVHVAFLASLTGFVILLHGAGPALVAQSEPSAGLMGTISSAEEGPMEGLGGQQPCRLDRQARAARPAVANFEP